MMMAGVIMSSKVSAENLAWATSTPTIFKEAASSATGIPLFTALNWGPRLRCRLGLCMASKKLPGMRSNFDVEEARRSSYMCCGVIRSPITDCQLSTPGCWGSSLSVTPSGIPILAASCFKPTRILGISRRSISGSLVPATPLVLGFCQSVAILWRARTDSWSLLPSFFVVQNQRNGSGVHSSSATNKTSFGGEFPSTLYLIESWLITLVRGSGALKGSMAMRCKFSLSSGSSSRSFLRRSFLALLSVECRVLSNRDSTEAAILRVRAIAWDMAFWARVKQGSRPSAEEGFSPSGAVVGP
mmetsp:Transcript_783/g.1859  ORF Transcript_783/g.1859 Transcript_783/m.1859 type:complete len:300 (+) Transcript_783:4661-5560(+)